ncbi:MAG: hypothetical protein WCG01_05125 [bacterium]
MKNTSNCDQAMAERKKCDRCQQPLKNSETNLCLYNNLFLAYGLKSDIGLCRACCLPLMVYFKGFLNVDLANYKEKIDSLTV